MTLSIISLGETVSTSRQWTTALSPRDGGGWMFVCLSYNADLDVPTEWVLIGLEANTVTIQLGADNRAANTNYQYPSANTGIVDNNQVRAANGRIFFPMHGNVGVPGVDNIVANITYYDPADESIHELPSFPDPAVGWHDAVIRVAFNVAGDLIYGGTQPSIGFKPMIFSLDPDTLAMTYIASVGDAPSVQPKYAYYLAAETGWLYVAVGQFPWELVAIDLSDNSWSVLLTTSGPGTQFIEFEDRAGLGWSVNTISDDVHTRYWLADGAISAYPGSGAPPGGARTVTPYVNPVVTPPDVDWSRGIGFFAWRPNGETGDFTEIDYTVQYVGGVAIESLATLPNGDVVGNSAQYSGFFVYHPLTDTREAFGIFGVSQPALCVVDATHVYISGYPNGATFVWDPTQPWNATGAIDLGAGIPGISRDAVSGKYLPETAGEWDLLLAAAGVVTGGPSIVLLCQEASGDLADSIGAFTFAAAGSGITYQSTVAGWAAKGIATTDGATGKFTNSDSGLPDINTTSCLVLTYVVVPGAPGTYRNLTTMGTSVQVRSFIKDGPQIAFFHNLTGGNGTANPSGEVRPIWTQSDITNSVGRFASDQETIEAVFDATVTGKYLAIVGEANGAPAGSTLYTAVFFGAAAEKTRAELAAITETLGFTVDWTP